MKSIKRATIYKISNSDNSIVYIGSTSRPLAKRWTAHKSCCNNPKARDCSIYPFMRLHGIEQFDITAIEILEDVSNDALRMKEQFWISQIKCVNERRAYLSEDERLEYDREYYQSNRDRIKAQRSERFECPCGGRYRRSDQSTHFRTRRHSNYINSSEGSEFSNE